jgi:hypothetical protein
VLNTPVAEFSLYLAGQGQVSALSKGTQVATATISAAALTWYALAAPDPSAAPIDELVITGAGGDGSVVVIGGLATSPVTNAEAGIHYAIVHAPAAMTATQEAPLSDPTTGNGEQALARAAGRDRTGVGGVRDRHRGDVRRADRRARSPGVAQFAEGSAAARHRALIAYDRQLPPCASAAA